MWQTYQRGPVRAIGLVAATCCLLQAGAAVAAEIDQSKPVAIEDKAAVFTVSLPQGKTVLQTWFYDAEDKELCGAYHVYARRAR